jgi:hypothetical protein
MILVTCDSCKAAAIAEGCELVFYENKPFFFCGASCFFFWTDVHSVAMEDISVVQAVEIGDKHYHEGLPKPIFSYVPFHQK